MHMSEHFHKMVLHPKYLEYRRSSVGDVRKRVPRVREVLDDDEDCV